MPEQFLHAPQIRPSIKQMGRVAMPQLMRRQMRVPAGDVDGLVAVLERLLDDTTLARRQGAAGRAWVTAERTAASNVGLATSA